MNHFSSIAAAAWIALYATVSLAQIQPPPLPPGSTQVRVEGGLNRQEAARQLRAHHHKFHNHKDVTRDDTVYGDPSQEAAGTASTSYAGLRPVTQTTTGVQMPPARPLPTAAECEALLPLREATAPSAAASAARAALKKLPAADAARLSANCELKKTQDLAAANAAKTPSKNQLGTTASLPKTSSGSTK